MKVLLIGNNGQLGSEFQLFFANEGIDFVSLDLPEFDVSNFGIVLTTIDSYRPDYIINCSAYNLVDLAEKEHWNALRVNTLGAHNLAVAAQKFNSFLVHFSTNYVFDGRRRSPYKEIDIPRPINFYGMSKYLGELAIQNQIEDYLIFRTSWLYGIGNQNFIFKFLDWISKKDEIYIADDEIGSPTSTRTIVEVTIRAMNKRITGLYHLVNSGFCSRYEWAKTIASLLKLDVTINPAKLKNFKALAKRPHFGVLSNKLISRALNILIPYWDKELGEYLLLLKNFSAGLNN